MTAVVIGEVKWRSVGHHSPEEARRYLLWLGRMEAVGRVAPAGPVTLAGNDWSAECGDVDDAEWLRDWLISECGFTRTMLRIAR